LTVIGTRSQATVIGLLDTRLEEPIAEADQSITVAVADADLASVLEVSEGAPLLRIDRQYYNTRKRPIELAISYFRPDQYSYRVSLHRSVH
jgi:DNA-binding GntR family transcriptional regulator